MAVMITNTPRQELNRKSLDELLRRYELSGLTVVIRDGRIEWEQIEPADRE